MHTLDNTLYYALQGLETRLAMQYNCHLGWSCRQIVRTGIEVAQTMLGDEDVEAHKESYYTFISRRMSSDPRETILVIIVMKVLFRLIENDSQARRCRSTFANDWGDEIEDMYHSYRRAVDEQIDIELSKQPNHTFTVTVMKTEQPQTVIHVAGNYIAEQHIDIHDNTNCNIYATAQEPKEDKEAQETYTPPIPNQGDYNAVREYVAERKKYDEQFKIFCDCHNLKQLCDYLSKLFGWIVDDHSLGTNMNRHR